MTHVACIGTAKRAGAVFGRYAASRLFGTTAMLSRYGATLRRARRIPSVADRHISEIVRGWKEAALLAHQQWQSIKHLVTATPGKPPTKGNHGV